MDQLARIETGPSFLCALSVHAEEHEGTVIIPPSSEVETVEF